MKNNFSLRELLPPPHIMWRLDCANKKRIFEQVSLFLENVAGVSRDELFRELIARERLGSTAIGNQGAIPHVRLESVQKVLCAFVYLREPIQYDAQNDGNSMVQNLFFLIVPEKANRRHLKLLAVLAEILMDNDLLKKLRECPDADAAHQQLIAWEEDHAESLRALFDKDD